MAIGPEALSGGALAAIIAAGAIIVVFVLLLLLVLYIYSAIALMTIAKKTKTPNAWLAWIPIANIYLMVSVAGLEWWWMFGFVLMFIPVIGWLAGMVWIAYVWYKIAEKRKYDGWIGVLMIIPLVNLVILGILAWRDN